jgi:hypothetical protein
MDGVAVVVATDTRRSSRLGRQELWKNCTVEFRQKCQFPTQQRNFGNATRAATLEIVKSRIRRQYRKQGFTDCRHLGSIRRWWAHREDRQTVLGGSRRSGWCLGRVDCGSRRRKAVTDGTERDRGAGGLQAAGDIVATKWTRCQDCGRKGYGDGSFVANQIHKILSNRVEPRKGFLRAGSTISLFRGRRKLTGMCQHKLVAQSNW